MKILHALELDELRDHLAEVIAYIQQDGRRVIVKHCGQHVAALVSTEDLNRLLDCETAESSH